MENLQLSYINRKLGQLYLSLGVQQIREHLNDFAPETAKDETGFTIPLSKIDLNMPTTPLDEKFYYVSLSNWEKIIEVLNPIAKLFPWERERFDCDNRAFLMSSLCSLIFRINTCGVVYCEVYDATTGALKYKHYANLISDGTNLYLWDVDAGGLYQKINSNPVVMGNNRYKLISLRIF